MPKKVTKPKEWKIGNIQFPHPAWIADDVDIWPVLAGLAGALILVIAFIASSSDSGLSSERKSSEARGPIAISTPTPTPIPDPVPLNGDIRYGLLAFTIKNTDSAPWNGCTLMLNPGFISSGYTYPLKHLDPGEETVIPLAAFAKGEDRFNPAEKKPTSLHITCADVGGKPGASDYSTK